MSVKSKILVLFDTDKDGYVSGYQQEFDDGHGNWQTPFDTANAIEVSPDTLDNVIIGATKMENGNLVLDKTKLAELQAETNKTMPTLEQSMINALGLRVAQLQAQLANKNGDGASV